MRKAILILVAVMPLVFVGCEREKEKINYVISIKCDDIIEHNKPFSLEVLLNPADAKTSKIELHLDGKQIQSQTSTTTPFQLTLKDLSVDNHKFAAFVTLDDGRVISVEKTFLFSVRLKDKYQGGIVVRLKTVDKHGIIAAESDLTGGDNGKYKYGAVGTDYKSYSMDDGYSNTNKFVHETRQVYAANACLNFNYNGYDDWYLPAYNEIAEFEPYMDILGIPIGSSYWSSTQIEGTINEAYAKGFPNDYVFGKVNGYGKLYKVRTCRKF